MLRIAKTAPEGVSFTELLLDETLCAGEVAVEKETARLAGGLNGKLFAKQKYELLLRIAAQAPLVFAGANIPEEEKDSYLLLADDAPETELRYGWKTDCYVAGKYSETLRQTGFFDAAVGGVLAQAKAAGNGERDVLTWMEQMIGRENAFYEIDDAARPILIYKGDPVCHNVLTVIAEQFGAAIERAGVPVEYFDLERQDVRDCLNYLDTHYRAVIGVQSYLFSVMMQDEIHYLHEYIHAPQYNFIFDHPIWLRSHMDYRGKNFYLLIHDANYRRFAERYYRQNAILFPPAGMEAQELQPETERSRGITFVGTYGDYWEQVLWIHQLERSERFLANRFLLVMRKNPDMPAEEAFAETLKQRGMALDDDAFLERMYDIRRTVYCVTFYYRKRVVETLLRAGITVEVFGDSWYRCPLRSYPNLICHPNVTVEESLVIYRQSKLSLNVMAWHKAGFTERMADIMLAGAVLVTDGSDFLKGRYTEDDMLIFDKKKLEELPQQIKYLLAEEDERQRIAENGRRKTKQEHTWDRRARQFLELLEGREDVFEESHCGDTVL